MQVDRSAAAVHRAVDGAADTADFYGGVGIGDS